MASSLAFLSAALRPRDLRCEFLRAPLCVGTAPRLSWQACHPERGQVQSAFRVLAASEPELLAEGRADLWDSGKIGSADPFAVYAGASLESGQECWWTVRVWDGEGRAGEYASPEPFTVGLLAPEDWSGEWIASPAHRRGVSPLFRTSFTLDKAVARAVAYVCGPGYNELRINGAKVGDAVLDPGWTDYTKRVLYTAHDITAFLRLGENVLGAMLGEGWLGNDHSSFTAHRHRQPHWIGVPCLRVQAHLTFVDGGTARIVTASDGSWLCCDGPIVDNNVYDGETYDARREQPGWDAPGFVPDAVHGWQAAAVAAPPRGALHPQMQEPIRVVQEIAPVAITEPREGVYVVDLGQNIAGWMRMRVSGPAGVEVTLKHAEILDENGLVNQAPLRRARATDTYILRGAGEERYEPRFTYHGFRYVQIEGYPGVPRAEDLTGCVVRSAVEMTGHFTCSDPLLNRIQQAVQWTECGNMHSVLTDCPQRDERMGWLNDATVRLEEAIYNFRLPALLAKWEDDIADTATEEGAILDTAPHIFGPDDRADAVCSSYLLIPWLCYAHYADRRLLERHYDGLKSWTDYLARDTEEGIVNFSHYGDWASPVAHCHPGNSAKSKETPGELMSTGYLYLNARLIADMARVLGRDEDTARYAGLAEATAHAFLRRYYNPETKVFAAGSQAAQVFPLWLGIVPEADREGVAAHVARDVVARGYRLTTGNLCTKYLLEMLTEYGYADIALKLATRTEYPSWGYMLANGATTIWERWELATGSAMNSHNHPMYGTISSWFFRCLAGIRIDPSVPGAGRLVIQPAFPADLRFVQARIETVRGEVVSRWSRDAEAIRLEVAVPFNTEATIRLPGNGDTAASVEFLTNSHAKPIDEPGICAFALGSGTHILKFNDYSKAPAIK